MRLEHLFEGFHQILQQVKPVGDLQTNLRTRSCHRTRVVPQGRSASGRVSRLWTRGVHTAPTGQGTTCGVEVTRRISRVAASSRCQESS